MLFLNRSTDVGLWPQEQTAVKTEQRMVKTALRILHQPGLCEQEGSGLKHISPGMSKVYVWTCLGEPGKHVATNINYIFSYMKYFSKFP